MLRIRRNDVDAHSAALVLQGRIETEWAELLEQECAELSRAGRRIELEFSEVVFIGRAGFEALVRLQRAGVTIVGCSPLLAALLEQEGIVAEKRPAGPADRPEAQKKNKRS